MKIRHVNVGTGIETLEEWMSEDGHELTGGGELVVSNPPSGKYKIVNIYLVWDAQKERYIVRIEHLDTPE